MTHSVFVIKLFRGEEFVGFHSGNGWRRSAGLAGAKIYANRANANRALAFHQFADRTHNRLTHKVVEFVVTEVVE